MAKAAGEVADVVLPHGGIMSDKYMREVLLPQIREGLVQSGRTWRDLDIATSGYLILGDTDSAIEQRFEAMRQPLSFYGSTRTYHKVLNPHGLTELGQKLHALSVQGKWTEMRETVKPDHILELAQTCTYDKYPEFLNDHREYASRTGFDMPRNTPEQVERFEYPMQQVQAVNVSGVPHGPTIPAEP